MSDSSRAKPSVVNLGKIGEARLELVPLLAECNPGIAPTEYNVVIAPARAATTVGKLGLLVAPDEVKESTAMAMQVGRIISMSPIAFNYDHWPSPDDKPKIGQLVWFARYAGALFEGIDGEEYRIVKDKDIGATINEDRPTITVTRTDIPTEFARTPEEVDAIARKVFTNVPHLQRTGY